MLCTVMIYISSPILSQYNNNIAVKLMFYTRLVAYSHELIFNFHTNLHISALKLNFILFDQHPIDILNMNEPEW